MESTRYRLRFVAGVSLNASTYGSGLYGSDTYGTRASDPLTSIRYFLVPLPSGYLSDPSWSYRQGDTIPPFVAKIVDEDGPIQLDAVDGAVLVLTPDDGRLGGPWTYELTIQTDTPNGDQLYREWLPHDLDAAGSYRLDVVLVFSSGRQMSVPVDDRHHLVIASDETYIPVGFTSRWDQARWDLAPWSTTP